VNSNAGNAQTILSFAGGNLTGSGTIVLNDNTNGNNARLDGDLTQAATHSITGHGNLNANLTNNGLVNANVTGTTLNIRGVTVTNTVTLEATNGGVLAINNGTAVNNTGGQINANGGNVSISGSVSITGGTLNSSAGNAIDLSTVSLTGVTIGAGTNVFIDPGTGTAFLGTGLTDNGTITVNPSAGNAGTQFLVASNLTVSGSGAILLNDNGNSNNARLDTGANITLTQAAGHTIAGHGAINASLINNGTVNANTATDVLVLQTSNMTNNGLFEATAGILNITGITISQGSTGQIAASPGTVNLNAATISNGTLNGAGIFEVVGTSTINSLTTHAAIQITAGQSLIANGNIVSNNTITVNDNQANAGTSINFGGATVSGTGVIFLNDNSNPNNARVDGTLTLGANQIITGHGNVNAVITNNGTILSNVTNAIININGQLNNAGLVRATNGGVINIAATAILANGTVGSGTLQVDANSSMTINSLSTNAGTILLNSATSSLTGLTSITNAGNITLTGGTATTLTLSGSLTGASNGQLNGNGTLIAGSLFGNLSTVAGVVRVKINGATTGTSKLTTLAIAGGTNAWTGDLDLTNNKVIVEDSTQHANTLATLENQVLYGRTHGAGITSSDLPAHAIVAVIDNAALPTPFSTFGGQVVDLNSILVAPELPGDADFSGKVDLTDLNTVLNHLGVADSHWTSGNFDGAATIDLTDLNDVLNNLGVSLPNANSIASPAAATPEPASLAIMGAGVSLLLRRRRC
jgi:fibronectin-binding autotransporter adhesin